MDGGSTHVPDELRRSKRDEPSSVREVAHVWQHGLSLPGITPLAGALSRGRANGSVRVQTMRSAQSIYGNYAFRRSLSGGVSLPVQRQTPPLHATNDQLLRRALATGVAANEIPQPYAVSQGYVEDEEEVPEPYAVSQGYVEDDVPEPYAVSQGYVEDEDDVPEPYAVSQGYVQEEVPEPYAVSQGYVEDEGEVPGSAHAGGNEAVAASSGGAGRFKTLALGEHYRGEDVKAAHYKQAKGAHISTRYLKTEEKRAPYRLGVGAGGKIMASGGAPLSTGAAKGMFAGGAGGHIFVMSPEGQFYSASAQAENKKGGMMGPGRVIAKEDPSDAESPFVPANNAPTAIAKAFHHSSFLGGGDVASAGELKVNEGMLSLISNASGHYKPGSEHMMQALQQLEGQGVATEQARVHLMGDFAEGKYDNSTEVTSAVGEYKAAGGNRDALVARHNVLKELRRAFGVMPDDAERAPQLNAAEVLQNMAEENLQDSQGAMQSGGYLEYSLGGGYH